MSDPGANAAASIRARLLDLAKARGEDFNLTLNRYATERWLYRLSQSTWREQFLLKGALLFDLWFDEPHRPTRDADFLGFGTDNEKQLAGIIAGVCSISADDGMSFDTGSISIDEIREEARYGGRRVHLTGGLDSARCSVQLDVGYGDAVTPGPEEATYPTLLETLPAPRLRVYPRATVLAEKFEAIVSLGMANTRLKDYFDLKALVREGRLEAEPLGMAIAATFQRRGTALPQGIPVGLSDAFAKDAAKLRQWSAFLERNRLVAPALADVIAELRSFMTEPLQAARAQDEKPPGIKST